MLTRCNNHPILSADDIGLRKSVMGHQKSADFCRSVNLSFLATGLRFAEFVLSPVGTGLKADISRTRFIKQPPTTTRAAL